MDGLSDFSEALARVTDHIKARYDGISELPTLPTREAIGRSIDSLPASIPHRGLGTAATVKYLTDEILPGCLQAQSGPRYFGFVTGGVTPAAQLADILGSSYDENVQVTLPDQTAATAIEARTLELVLDLLDIPRENYLGRTITTGATSSNVLGLACARDWLYAQSPHTPQNYSFSRSGPPRSPSLPDQPIIILALHPHFSILKAAALVGLGSGPNVVRSMPSENYDELAFDLAALQSRLEEEKRAGRGVIVTYGLGEVNTGGFGLGLRDVAALCELYGAWLHVDAAFGGFAGVVPELKHFVEGMELAHSLTLDGHKWLNVPYDCGLFFTRLSTALPGLFAPPEAPAYLAPSTAEVDEDKSAQGQGGRVDHAAVPSPLYVNIENSRRFRALPLLASLMSLGREGYTDLIRRNVTFARRIADYIDRSPQYDLLNYSPGYTAGPAAGQTHQAPIIPLNIVLFAPSSASRFEDAAALTKAVNGTREMYVTGTKWGGRAAVRLAVSNWRTGLGGDDEVRRIERLLDAVSIRQPQQAVI